MLRNISFLKQGQGGQKAEDLREEAGGRRQEEGKWRGGLALPVRAAQGVAASAHRPHLDSMKTELGTVTQRKAAGDRDSAGKAQPGASRGKDYSAGWGAPSGL